MSTDGDVNRAINALHQTLNDQQPPELDPERLREIAVGATGGVVPFSVHVDELVAAPTAHLFDEDGQRVITVRREADGAWTITRDVPPRDDVAIPRP
jgi:hypothetical protein